MSEDLFNKETYVTNHIYSYTHKAYIANASDTDNSVGRNLQYLNGHEICANDEGHGIKSGHSSKRSIMCYFKISLSF